MTTLAYPYASGDLLEDRNTYFYTSFGGQDFLHAWRHQRTAAMAACEADRGIPGDTEDSAPVVQILRRLNAAMEASSPLAADRVVLDHILQRFEVSKRLHDDYTAAWRPLDPTRYYGLGRYLLLAEILVRATALTADLRYLNGVLKCLDTLTSDNMMAMADRSGRARLRVLLEQERNLVDQVAARSPAQPRRAISSIPLEPHKTLIVLQGIGLAAAPTARSRAYIQALVAYGLHPEFVLLLGDHDAPSPAAPTPPRRWKDISLVNLDESVIATCRRAAIPTHMAPTSSINDAPALEALQQLQPHTLIYSGAGGQIVSPEVLGLGVRFLHMHAGYIPDYRGSTTIYYALLNGESPAVTAIFLDAQIDTGGILARHSYPTPDRSIDIDQIYDASIRADTLARLLRDYVTTGMFTAPQPQQQDQGTTYFVIHPVLKHLAILGLPDHKS